MYVNNETGAVHDVGSTPQSMGLWRGGIHRAAASRDQRHPHGGAQAAAAPCLRPGCGCTRTPCRRQDTRLWAWRRAGRWTAWTSWTGARLGWRGAARVPVCPQVSWAARRGRPRASSAGVARLAARGAADVRRAPTDGPATRDGGCGQRASDSSLPAAAVLAMTAALEDATCPKKAVERQRHYTAMAQAVWEVLQSRLAGAGADASRPFPHVPGGLVLPTGPAWPWDRVGRHPQANPVWRTSSASAFAAPIGATCRPPWSGTTAPWFRAAARAPPTPSCRRTCWPPCSPRRRHAGGAASPVPEEYINGSVRISLSHVNTMEEVQTRLCPALAQLLREFS